MVTLFCHISVLKCGSFEGIVLFYQAKKKKKKKKKKKNQCSVILSLSKAKAKILHKPGHVILTCITKICLYNYDPLKPHFYIVKLGFTGVDIIFLISAQKHRLWYSLEPPRRGGSNEYPQSMF